MTNFKEFTKMREINEGKVNPITLILSDIGDTYTISIVGFADVHEDNYEEGEGDNVNNFSLDPINKTSNSASSLIGDIRTIVKEFISEGNLYLTYNEKYMGIYDNKLEYSATVDSNNGEPTKGEINNWKKGNFTLYTLRASFNISVNGSTLTDRTLKAIFPKAD